MELTGSQIIVECLKEQGVDTVFGYPGGSILNVYDELYRHQEEIHHILTSHEQGAAHAADGYARASGKVGVCFATSGPGATNLVTGIATAMMDSVPIVAITCNVFLPLLGRDSFQEVDIAGVAMPITKHSIIVKDVKDLAETLRMAFYIAKSGRPGPVLVDVTKDVTAALCEYEYQKPKPVETVQKYDQKELEVVTSMIQKAKKPFVLVGGGAVISEAEEEIMELVTKMDTPVCDTLMGKGVFPATHEAYTGMIGMHGTKASNIGVSKCDLLLVLGARFSDRVIGNAKKFATNAKIIHIDIDAAEINKNIHVDASLVGDLKLVLRDLNKQIQSLNHEEWKKEIAALKEQYPLSYDTTALTGPYVLETLAKVTEGKAIVSTDVGQHQMWTAQYFPFSHGRQFLTSGGLGTMGYGLGAVIGAKMAKPDAVCVNIAGDGCFRMNMNELATASRYDIPIIEIVLNNHVLGMVRQWQNMFYGGRYSHTVLEDKVDFCKVAEGLGCEAIEVTRKDEVEPAIRRAIALKKPVLINCIIPKDDKVFPMVPAGAAIKDVIDEKDYLEQSSK